MAKELIEINNETQAADIQSYVLFSEASIFDYYLSPIAKQFYIKFPKADLIIADKPLKDVLKTIHDDTYSFAILLIGSDIRQDIQQYYPNILQIPISSHPLKVLAKKNSKWLQPILKYNKTVRLEDVASLPLITVGWNSSATSTITRLLKPCGTPNIINIAPNLAALSSFIDNDIGITLGIEKNSPIKYAESVPLETDIPLTLDYTFFYNEKLSPTIANKLIQIVQESFSRI